ncbi:hypothetical protein WME88_13660 [Sorangium sp. So ce216]
MAVLVCAVGCEPSVGGGAGGSGGQGGTGGTGGEGGTGGTGGTGGEGGTGGTAPALAWARAYGGPGVDQGSSIASDAEGNFYVTGSFEGTVDFGAGPLTSAGQEDIFLLKLASSGELLWSKRFGKHHREQATTVAVDGNGDLLLAGHYRGNGVTSDDSVDFGGGPLPSFEGAAEGFLVKLDGDGNHIWSQGSIMAGGGGSYVPTMAVDALGQVYILVSGGTGASLRKMDVTGEYLWGARLVDGGDLYFTTSLALDSAGNAVVAVGYQTGPGGCPCLETFSVRKLTPAGDTLWIRNFSNSAPSLSLDHNEGAMAHAVAVNAADEIFAAGSSHGDVDFGGGVLPAGNVLVKLDANGEHVFSRRFRFVSAMVGDPDGNLLVAAGHLSRLDAIGTELWTTPFSTPGSGLSLSPLGTIGLIGTTSRASDFGAGPLPYAGAEDIVVASLSP